MMLPNRTLNGDLACRFHEPWLGPHFLCRWHTAITCGVPVESIPLPDASASLPKLLGPALSPPMREERRGQGELFVNEDVTPALK